MAQTDLAKNLIKLYGFKEDQIPIIYTGLRKGEKMYEEISIDYEMLTKSEYLKLFISKENNFNINKEELSKMIKELSKAADTYDETLMKKLLKKYVPEYNCN